MTKHIENSDRGITINKGLAWTIVSGLVCFGVYSGISLGTLNSGLDQVTRDNSRTIEAREKLNDRVRRLETFQSSTEATMRGLGSSLTEIKRDLRENNQLLRSALTGIRERP